mmetsp:Transcript_89888/g.279260  ORF Transcript_89888/g.279260 Transcript_89888/m.279260 type:complete len:200 (+) Transcript_89888:245-844(+)
MAHGCMLAACRPTPELHAANEVPAVQKATVMQHQQGPAAGVQLQRPDGTPGAATRLPAAAWAAACAHREASFDMPGVGLGLALCACNDDLVAVPTGKQGRLARHRSARQPRHARELPPCWSRQDGGSSAGAPWWWKRGQLLPTAGARGVQLFASIRTAEHGIGVGAPNPDRGFQPAVWKAPSSAEGEAVTEEEHGVVAM